MQVAAAPLVSPDGSLLMMYCVTPDKYVTWNDWKKVGCSEHAASIMCGWKHGSPADLTPSEHWKMIAVSATSRTRPRSTFS